jgi:HEPN domain-containing protein
LRENGFEGAHDEFREAREDLVDGRTKDVILKAFKSFESTLKTVLNQHSRDIMELLRLFRERGFMDDIPEAPAQALERRCLDHW